MFDEKIYATPDEDDPLPEKMPRFRVNNPWEKPAYVIEYGKGKEFGIDFPPVYWRDISHVKVWYHGMSEGELGFFLKNGGKIYSLETSNLFGSKVLCVSAQKQTANNFAKLDRGSVLRKMGVDSGRPLILEIPVDNLEIIIGCSVEAYTLPVTKENCTINYL